MNFKFYVTCEKAVDEKNIFVAFKKLPKFFKLKKIPKPDEKYSCFNVIYETNTLAAILFSKNTKN